MDAVAVTGFKNAKKSFTGSSVNSETERKGMLNANIVNAANSGVYGPYPTGSATIYGLHDRFEPENTHEPARTS